MRTKTTLLIGSGLALALAAAIWTPVRAQPDHEDGAAMTPAQMVEHCKDMKEQKQKMAADMKAQDSELTERLARMNAAPDDRKVGLVAGVVTLMAEQRVAMNVRHAKTEDAMMQHMMRHMQTGKDSMPHCPMMEGSDDKAAGAPDAHHDGK